MKEVARSYVWWPNLVGDLEGMVRLWLSCPATRLLPTVAPVTPWVWPHMLWERLHMDFAHKEGHDFLLVVDMHSKWPEILTMTSTTGQAAVVAVRDVFARFRLPTQVVTDNGPQFVSSEFTLFLQRNGIKHIRVSPYHPASNGAAERLVQSFKRSLSAAAASTVSIRQRLAEFLLSYRTTPHATTGRTPFSLLMNREC